jgi:predicted transposase YbfD/YdcC
MFVYHHKLPQKGLPMDYTNFTLALPPGPLQFDPTSLYAALCTVPDQRHRRGVRYPLAPMLFIALFAKLLGHHHPRAIAHFATLHAAQLCTFFQLERSSMPHHTTWSRWFKHAINDEALQAVCATFFAQVNATRHQQLPSDTPAQLTLDGKTLRGTIPSGQTRGDHLLSIYDPHTAIVIVQQQVDSKTNEIPVAQSMLEQLDLSGKIVTADAMHTQTNTARKIVAAGGDYLVTVKGNQSNFGDDISFLFAAENPAWRKGSQWVDFDCYSTMEKGHGRIEWRRLTCSMMLNQYGSFPHMGQVFMIERVCWGNDGRALREERGYGVTSLSRRQAGAQELLAILRTHWQIENGLHWRRDQILNEDGTRMKRNSGGAVLATLNNLVVSLVGRRNLAAALREYAARPVLALALLTSSP